MPYRFADNWQFSAIMPLVKNDNTYPGISPKIRRLGIRPYLFGTKHLIQITCVWQVHTRQICDLPSYWFFGYCCPLVKVPYSDG